MTQHENLAAALAAFQAELPKLIKDEKASVKGETRDGRSYDRSYGYADLAQVVETILPALGKHGLSIMSRTTADNGAFLLEVKLLHAGGEYETAVWPLPIPGGRGGGPQDIGSAMTYGRRYLTLALSGAYPGGEDDDGAKAQQSARESWDDAKPVRPSNRPVSAPPTQAPAEPPRPPKTSWTDTEVYDIQARMGTETLAAALRAYDWMAGKGLHNQTVGHPDHPDDAPMNATTVISVKIAAAAQAETSPEIIDQLRAQAGNRGLLKVMVSPTEALDQVIYEARELAVHALVEQAKDDTPDPQAE